MAAELDQAEDGNFQSFPSFRSFEGNLKQFEEETLTKFVVATKDKSFGQEDPKPGAKKIMWELKYVPFDGVPFMVVGRKVYSCHQGKDKSKKIKERRQQQRLLEDHSDHACKERRRLLQDSKKLDCPARIYCVHLLRFSGYKIPDGLPKQRTESAKHLKRLLATNPSAVKLEEQYVACFPEIEEHKNHPVSGEAAEVREPVDPRIQRHIEKLALFGARKVSEVRRHISTPPGDATSTPPEDATSTPPEDDTSTPSEDDTSTPPEDDTSTPPEDDTSTPPGDDTSIPSRDAIPANPNNKIKKRQKCGSLLREITDLTYHLQDESSLDSVIGSLTNLLEYVRLHTPHDETLPLSYTPPSKKARPSIKPLSTVPKKHPFSGRFGRRAEEMRSSTHK